MLWPTFTWAQSNNPNSRDPEPQRHKSYHPAQKRSSKKTYNLNAEFDQLVVEYQQRMKRNVKKYKKLSRKLKKPKYSDPSYFGHKRKPKIRKTRKRKFCQECEIVH